MRVDRRTALALFGGAALAACGRTADRTVLRVGNQRGGTKSMMEASGVLATLPVKVEWSEFPAAQHLLEAIGAGAVDLGAVGDAPFLFAYQAGSPIRAVQAVRYQPRNPAVTLLVRKGSPIVRIQQLAGRRIATGRGSVGHLLALRTLARAGLGADAVTFSFLPPGDARDAFFSGAVDVWATWSPYTAAAILHEQAVPLVDGRDLVSYGFLAASETAIAARRDLLTGFLRAYAAAERWAGTHTDAYARAMAKETGLPFDVARYTVDRELVPVPSDATVVEAQQQVLRTFAATGAVKANRPLAAAYDASFDTALAS